ncbi:MAG: SUF system NifU family Fe-S cluster assembly protein [Candidatus Levybacteria bacterium]|nr:SUF system NifU family Fe-S cluster assembly protein [Candidatus Levybacteria bacterium]
MDRQTLYREELLEHYRNPLNFGELSDYTVSAKQTNPFCGDDVEMFIKLNEDKVEDIRFTGQGCAISMAGASILTERVKGKVKSQLTKFSENDMLNLLGIEVSETRKKCALLALSVLKDCIYGVKSKS